MLTRVFCDNFKALVNFEFRPDQLCLLLGDNASGKSSFLEDTGRLSDLIVITSDNPRSEDPNHIIDEIKRGIVVPADRTPPGGTAAKSTPHLAIVDRKAAIERAVREAAAGDKSRRRVRGGTGPSSHGPRSPCTVHRRTAESRR